ncbi:hypothetical protein GPJ56_008580 [Histomonas meleagridis]|uniref:uncharacterized protein n=1 Tax=Histomonas meleagridis TaxID=135588 RepID=UPI003559B688|nr:hypothetical protein GPJ56_008580 [Histomonas meleagridis]KAH0805843.1 hypothetical protein GO595_001482 [Histomonas meleagridis]
MYKPDFPTRNHIELQKSHIQIGSRKGSQWETTYNSTMKPQSRDVSPQTIDTIALQQTHWTVGNDSSEKISEAHSAYHKYNVQNNINPAYTRNQMMRTTFKLGDGSPMESRVNNMATASHAPKRESFREQMEATHFEIKNPYSNDKWETTNHADFKPIKSNPAQTVNLQLNKGEGAKASFGNIEAPMESINHSTYVDFSKRPNDIIRNRVTTISGNQIEFGQNTTNKWQRTNFVIGTDRPSYSTTTGDATRKPQSAYVDPKLAHQRRVDFGRSSFATGYKYPSVTRTTMQDAIQPHPEFKPPPMADKTAFVSHQEYVNTNERPTTTNRATYKPCKYEYVAPINNRLQESHASFGSPYINENHTLYNDTFKKFDNSQNKVDMEAIRNFHMSHHSDLMRTDAKTEITTNQASYTGFPGFKPPPTCDALKGSNNVVPNDPRFNLKKSAMKEDYIPYKNALPPKPIDNHLQQSHIQMQGNQSSYSTTQGDYFQFKTYRMPNEQS